METAQSTRGIGSRSYMSPEMAKVTSANPNEFTDVWSCGVAFCLMYAAALPDEDWALRSNRDPSYYKKWCNRNDAHPSKEMCDMFDLIFRIEFPSTRNHTTGGDNLRASADELLECEWLQSGIAT